jgi:hypothetical protein
MACIIAGCPNNAENNFSVRLRRPDTTAIWAPNTDAYVCDEHAYQGLKIWVSLTPNNTGTIETAVTSETNPVYSRQTPIKQPAEPAHVDDEQQS